ncbi:alpha/beta fold hydrolase (plasmid) [Mycetohabitans endofungorum]|nr:alpha/beta fold hydrolase [Mycetohabitans sp. B3]
MGNPSKTVQKTSDAEGMLDVGNGHSIYWRELGNPQAQPIVVLHGGPGGATSLGWADHLDATRWRIVFFDQRGCGRSTPFGELEHNGIVDLVGDIEKLREHLRIECWTVFGGSWGTTLALAYGSTHPQRCSGFLLRGVYLARKRDLAIENSRCDDLLNEIVDAMTKCIDLLQVLSQRVFGQHDQRSARHHGALDLGEDRGKIG